MAGDKWSFVWIVICSRNQWHGRKEGRMVDANKETITVPPPPDRLQEWLP